MAPDVDDPSDISGKAKRQLDRVHDQVDHEPTRSAIISWANDMMTRDLSPATVTNRVNPIVKLHERADVLLTEFDSASAVTNLLAELQNGDHPAVGPDGLAEGTIRQYRQACKLFFRDELDRDWGDDIVIGSTEPSPITEEQILMDTDVDALLEAAENPRDAALVAFLVVTGQRITATLSIRVGDVTLDEQVASVTLNDDAQGLKGASGPRPLLWARPYVATWLANHPRRDDPEAPLFCATQSGRRPKDDGTWVEWSVGDPISPSKARKDLRKLADDADVAREKVKPHNFRHTAITRMRDEGVSDDRIRFMVGVDQESTILERYDKQSDERMMARVREDYGMDVPADGESDVGRPTLEVCPQCQAPLRPTARYCDSCGMPMDADAAEARSSAEDAVADDMAEEDDPLKRRIAREGFDHMDDPEFMDELADKVADKLSDSH